MFRNSATVAMRQTSLFECTSVCLAKKSVSSPASKTKSPQPTAAAAAHAASRFKSTPLQSTKDVSKGTTPASKIFAKSFFGSGDSKKSDDWLDLDDSKASPTTATSAATKKKGGKNAAVADVVKKGRRGTRAEPQRRPAGVRRPFSLHSDIEKNSYRAAVRRNLLALKDTKAAADAVKKNLQLLASKKKDTPSAKRTAANQKRSRVHSPFYSDQALRFRGGSGTVAVAAAKKQMRKRVSGASSDDTFVDDHIHSTQKPLNGSDCMNPIAINESFFTSYERKQFSRLKNATRSLRLRFNRKMGTIETVSQKDVTRRYGMYKMWDKLLLNVKSVDATTPLVGHGKKKSQKN